MKDVYPGEYGAVAQGPEDCAILFLFCPYCRATNTALCPKDQLRWPLEPLRATCPHCKREHDYAPRP